MNNRERTREKKKENIFYLCTLMDEKITIFDVARLAGVSKGTVDRVLHNRGEVSEKTTRKVLKAIEDLKYEPNLYASLLATKTPHVVACLLPEFQEGEYWGMLNRGIIAGGEQVASLNIKTVVFYYDQYDAASFRKACDELLAINPAGVVLPPLFSSDTMVLTRKLVERGIPYVYVDSKLEEDEYFAYYGMPMYKSGTLSAALLTERCDESMLQEMAAIRINRDKLGQSDPTVERRAGFMDYIKSHFPGCQVHSVFINPSDPGETYRTLDDFFRSHPGIRHIVVFSSRVHLISRYVQDHPVKGRRIIAFDNLEKNVSMLRDGQVEILISQHTENQARYAVATLADYILLRKFPARRDNYMHMDILTRYNMEDY